AFDLFGGALLTGGASGMEVVNMGKQAVAGAAGLAGAALTGGATVAAAALTGGAVLASASALQADGRAGGAYLGTDPAKTEGRVRQLKTIAGYALGRSETVRGAIEGAHEVRTLGRNFRDGEVQQHGPDILDYLRAGSSMSGFGSSPWLAMRLSPSLRAAYDQIGGRRYDYDLLAESFDEDGAPVGAKGVSGTATGSGRPGRELVDRFATLEQAITRLTEALAGRQAADPAPERVTPAPDRLGEDGPTTGGMQDVAPTSAVRLETTDESRRQTIQTVLERLQEPDSLSGQAAYQTLVTFTGEGNAGLLQAAVAQHSAAAVQEAATATADLVAQHRAQQVSDAGILRAFQSGDATAAVREVLAAHGAAAPLSDTQLGAVADMVLLPQRRLTRRELATVIGEQVAAGATSEQAVADALGLPVNFGGQMGAIRGVMAGAAAMSLSPDELARLADLIRAGLRDAARAELTGRGHRPELVHTFVSDLAALPGVMLVPQTTASRPQQSGETDEA
ncbi:MAG: hypothetical protein ACRDHL_06880, partial [Candidatus Promineifilaceae bacterium]